MSLVMHSINKSFFGKPANVDVSLEVKDGEIHALLGENGAGKTTLMNMLYGIYTKDSGEIIYNGQTVEFNSPKDAIDARIGMVHQHFMLVPTLTVAQNITLGLKTKGYPFPNKKEINDSITKVSQKYGLSVDPQALVSSLSVGQQQRVEILKLLYRDVQLLILDEPTAVLTPQEIESFFNVLRKLKADGCSIIIITHKIPEIMNIADSVTVLRDGYKVGSFSMDDIDELELSNRMIGRELKRIDRSNIKRPKDNDQLEIKSVSLIENGIKRLDNIDLSVKQGEILGIAGVDGNGQKEIAETILGIRKQSEGDIYLDGKLLNELSVQQRKRIGIGYISDDRHNDGLVMDMDLIGNMLLKKHSQKEFIKNGLIDQKLAREYTQKAVDEFSIKTPSLTSPIRYLSGGNQQKLILSREISDTPKMLIAFQPTRGLDIGATEFIWQNLIKCKEEGCSVLLISADLEEIFALSDRVAVMYKGQVMDVLENDDRLTASQLGLLMAGKKDTNDIKGDAV